MSARRYDISLRVFDSIFTGNVELTTRRKILYLQKAMYYFVYYINDSYNAAIFRSFSEDFRI